MFRDDLRCIKPIKIFVSILWTQAAEFFGALASVMQPAAANDLFGGLALPTEIPLYADMRISV